MNPPTSPSEQTSEQNEDGPTPSAALVEVLRLKPGDILLVKVPLADLVPKDRAHYMGAFKQTMRALLDLAGHDKVQIAIVAKDVDFSVIEATAELGEPRPG